MEQTGLILHISGVKAYEVLKIFIPLQWWRAGRSFWLGCFR